MNKIEEHVWVAKIDSQFSNEFETDVTCIICGMSGSKDNITGIVIWPAT